VAWGGQSFVYTIPSKASITFKWAPTVSISEKYAPFLLFGRKISVRQTAGGISVIFPSVNTYTVELFDMSGRALMRKNVSGDKALLYSCGLGRGMYVVRITCGANSFLRQFLWISGN
jgi:hypothetical protein